jgi:DNA repair exonuclease SbcCD ATPase subunit
MELRAVNFLRGLNGSGKSTLALAIEVALSGRCSITDEGGRGYEQLVRSGERAAVIVLECDQATVTTTLDRVAGRTFKVEVSGQQTRIGKQAQEWIAEHFATPDVINASLNAWRFLELPESEQAKLLARILLPAKLELPDDMKTLMAGDRLSVVERPTLFQTIEATVQSITQARTDVNRKIRDLKAIEEPPPLPMTRTAIKEEIAQLQQKEAEANVELLRVSNINTVKAQQEQQHAALTLEIADIKAKLPSLQTKLLSQEMRADLEKVVHHKAHIEELHNALTFERARLVRITADIEQLSKQSDSDVCPYCKSALSQSSRQNLFAPLLSQQNEANGAIRKLEKELKKYGNPAGAAVMLSEDDHTRNQCKEYDTTLIRLESQLSSHDNIAALPSADSEDALKAEIARVRALIVSKLEVLVKIVELEQQHTTYQEQLTLRNNSEQRAKRLDLLLLHFNDLKSKLIAERQDIFAARINEVLQWWGYTLEFNIEPYQLIIREAKSNAALQPHQLSASERYRLGVALSIAIANWTGLRLLVADGADILDKTQKSQLASGIYEADLDQAIITSTGLAGTFQADDTAFYTFFKVDGITETELDAVTDNAAAVVAHGA